MRWLCIFLMLGNSVHAAVLFQSVNSSPLDYRAALRADSGLQTPTQAYFKAHPSIENRSRLLSLFAEAQKAFLGNSKDEARAQFINLLMLASEDDWGRSEREVFLQAYFRLAQMDLDSDQQTKYLSQALAIGDDLEVPADLFPPPFVRRFAQLKNEIPRGQIPARFFQDGWSAILINGTVCNRQNCSAVALVPGEARITFVSDQWIPFTVNVELSELTSVNPKRVAWIGGDCEKTIFHAQAEMAKEKRAFWSLTCGAAPKINLQPIARSDALPRLDVQTKSSAFYKSPWFWAGVSAVAVAVIVASAQKSSGEKKPSTAYGY